MKVYIIDAFTNKLFSGNSAAVCLLDNWLPDELMQGIAFENNLAETAYIVSEPEGYRIRWFTPAIEVDLCGHATLAAAHVMLRHLGLDKEKVEFNSRSGKLTVTRLDDLLTLDFPADTLSRVEISTGLEQCFSVKPVEIWKGKTDYLFVFEKQADIEGFTPNLKAISQLDARGVIATAQGTDVDFVSRFFAPQSGIDEDPVTGSAHTSLSVYWRGKMNKTTFTAKQLSARGGKLVCELAGDRVKISGNAVTYLIGDIQLNKTK